MKRAAAAAVMLVGCLLLAGCASSSDAPSSSTSAGSPPASASNTATESTPANSQPTAAAATITIKDFSFDVTGSPAPGAMVMVTNKDDTAHSVTADTDNAFDVTIQPGKTEMFAAPKTAGSYKFHCMFHANMHGSLTVAG